MSTNGNRSKGIGWIIMYIFTGAVDLFQIFVSATGIGIVASEFVEFAMPFILIFVFQFIIKASVITKPDRLGSIAGALGLGALTGGIAPFWIVDVWYIQRSVKKEDAEYNRQEQKQQLLTNNTRQTLYRDGVRQPQRLGQGEGNDSGPQYKEGIRTPNGGLK